MSGKTGQINYFNSLLGKELNQTYRIDTQVALGGMGAVFRGVNLQTNESVAIKVISPHLTANSIFVKRFQREAKVGAILSHPNIVKVHEFGQTPDGILFMAMEFIEGKTLDEYLSHAAPLTAMRCLEILQPLAEALDAAHKRNILHRDLKPANILMTKDKNGKESIKLVDFGLVKLMQPDSEITAGNNLTGLGEACGTPYYMSPEQIIGQALGPTADIYGLGIILYQMLTAKMPIESNNVRQILAIKINQDIGPPSEKFPFIPKVLDPVVQKSLARDPRKRYQTGRELFEDFQRAAFEISLEYSQATQPVLDQSVLSDVRKNYVENNEDLSLQVAVNNSHFAPAVEKEINNKPSVLLPNNSVPITVEPVVNRAVDPISSPNLIPTVEKPTYLSKSSNSNEVSSPPPLKVTDFNDRQVKFLIVMVGVLFGLLVIAAILLFMQNK